jgi:2,3-dihydroxybenzoate-AMP ligase
MLEGVVAYPPEFVERYRAAGLWLGRSLWELFSDCFERYAERTALVHAGGRLSYGQVRAGADRLADGLAGRGIRRLDRVVVQLPNLTEFVLLHFALQRLGAIPIMALPAHREREIGHFIELAGARCYVAQDAGLAEVVRSQQPTLEQVLMLDDLRRLLAGEAGGPVPESSSLDPQDPAVFLLSGGTTGLPKLIPRSHDDYWYNSIASGDVNDIRPEDALLAVLPLGHNFALACPGLQGFLQRGARVVLSETTAAAENLALIEREGITHLELVPALLIRWLNDPGFTAAALRTVRIVNTGGQRLHPEVKRRCEEVLPGCTVQEVLGMAEGLLCYVRLDDSVEVRYETAGRPVSELDELRIVDEEDQEVSPGEVGELLTRGPYTIRGYFRAREHNSGAFTTDGFYRTGDLVRLHPSGNLVVEGRKKDLINRAGEKISAEEVENLIMSHPAVLNVACVPVADAVLGERMCACVIPKPGTSLSLEELASFLLAKGIAKFKLPERLELLEEFPMTRVGKVSKRHLVELVKDFPGS